MSKKLISALILATIVTSMSGCALTDSINKLLGKSTKISRIPLTEGKIRRPTPTANAQSIAKEVEVFALGKDNIDISFTKSGTASSTTLTYIVPSVTARIVDIKATVGQKVKKGDLLITLGNFITTEIADKQYETAEKGLELLKTSQFITDYSAIKNIEVATNGVKTAHESYQNAIKGKLNAEKVYDEQLDSAGMAHDLAKDSYSHAKSGYSKLQSAITKLQEKITALGNTISQLPENDPQLKDLETAKSKLEEALSTAQGQVDTVQFAITQADAGRDQTENAEDLLAASHTAQMDQLDFAIFAAKTAYENSAKQFEVAVSGLDLQKIALKGQILQAEMGLESAKLNSNQKYLTSPIEGIVTSISATAKKGSLTAPGQILMKVENPKKLSIHTGVNFEEASLITQGDKVVITGTGIKNPIEGNIVSISPAANDTSKKIDVEIEFTNNKEVIPGSLVKIEFSPKTDKKFIPLNSIYTENLNEYIKIIDENNKVVAKEITLGDIIGEYVEVTGLKGDEKIIKSPSASIQEGDRVQESTTK